MPDREIREIKSHAKFCWFTVCIATCMEKDMYNLLVKRNATLNPEVFVSSLDEVVQRRHPSFRGATQNSSFNVAFLLTSTVCAKIKLDVLYCVKWILILRRWFTFQILQDDSVRRHDTHIHLIVTILGHSKNISNCHSCMNSDGRMKKISHFLRLP